MLKNVFRMRLAMIAVLLAMVVGAGAGQVAAQDAHWIQIEAQKSIRDTRARAQFYAQRFPDTHAFLTPSGWYAITIGPMSEDEANRQVNELKASGRIPSDSLVTDGRNHLSQLWPISVGTGAVPATGSADSDAQADIETAAADETPEETAEAPAEPEAEPEIVPIEDRDLRGTQQAERGWSRAQKMEYQEYLRWTGDYDAAIDGAYGRGTRSAISAFQEREGYQPTGYLTTGQIIVLRQRYRALVAPLGVATLRDEQAGIEMLYPSFLVQKGKVEPPFIEYDTRGDRDVRMILISQPGGDDVMESLYDIIETFDYVPAEGYRAKNRGWFVLSGADENIVSYTYARTDNGLVKGFTIIWPPKMNKVMQKFAVEMYESFTPLPEYVLDESIGYGDGPDEPTDLSEGLDTPLPASSASGFVVNGEGVVITDTANIEGCSRITLAEDGVELELLAQNPGLELAVLRPKDAFTPASYALFSSEAPEIGAEVTVSGFSFPEVMEIATLNYGTLTDLKGADGDERALRVSVFAERGDVGGPVLDDRGAVIGMQMLRPAKEGEPEYVNFALRVAELREMLDRHGITYGLATGFDAAAAEDVAFMAGDFTVKVSCWK